MRYFSYSTTNCVYLLCNRVSFYDCGYDSMPCLVDSRRDAKEVNHANKYTGGNVLGVLICSATFLFCASVDYLKHLEDEGGEQDDGRRDEGYH